MDRTGFAPGDLCTPADLRVLPPLEKRDIQQQRDRMVAQDWPRDDLIANKTGGSTGEPLSFFLSHDRRRSRTAATIRHNRWAGWDIGDKVALMWGAPRDLPNHRRWRTWLRSVLLDRQLFLDTGHITEEKLATFEKSLKRFRPKIILAYAQAAVLFARYLQSNQINAYRPHAIVTSAEVLEQSDRRLIEDVFGCPVFNRYGSREVSVVASECDAHRGLHIMAEGLHVEVVTNSGQHDVMSAGPQQPGSILVTDLLNYAMPLIRYRIGDVGAWAAGSCPCGRNLPRLSHIAGRVTDFLVGADGRLVSGAFLSLYVIGCRPSLGQVQIHQETAGEVLYRIKQLPEDYDPADIEFLQTKTRQYLGPSTTVDFEFTDDIAPEPSGKYILSRSTVAPEFF
jgi:phenylacetate-CoA ligase